MFDSSLGYGVAPTPPTSSVKSPVDFLDYLLDFTQEFGSNGGSPGDTLLAVSGISVSPPGLSISNINIVSGGLAVLFWAASGVVGQTYTITVTATTTAGRIYAREGFIPVGPA